MGSIGQLLSSVLFGVFAILSGYLADSRSPQVALLVCHCVGLIAMPIYWWLHRAVEAETRRDSVDVAAQQSTSVSDGDV